MAVCTRAQPPIITDVQPYKAATGAPVTILGSGFSPSRTGNKVLFNASPAQVLSASSTQLTVLVPPAATYGLISVHTQGLSAQTRVPFSPINTGDSLVPLALNDIIEVQNSPLSNMPHNSAHSADLDGDGLSDIVAIKVNTPRELVWYRTRILNGQPDFAETGKINDLPGANFLLKIADINGDGKVDVVAANSAQDSIYFFLNQSTPSNIQFIKALALPTGQYPVDLTITDLNGDGLLDVAVVHLNSNPIRLYIRSTPAAMAYQVIDLPNSFDCSSVLAADFNGDGRTDIITLNAFAQATLHTNTTTPGSPPSFTQTTFTGIGTQVVECMLTDANEDGWPDILLLGNNHARVMLNNKSIPVSFTFRDPTAFNQFSFITYPAILADLNGNGRPEIVAGFNNKTQVYIGPDILQTPPPWAYSPVYANAGSVISSQTVGDVTGDGKLDILGFNQTGNLVISSIRPQLFHLSDFNPKSGGHAMPVSITGQNLSGTTQVSFGGVAADSFHFISPQLIIAYPSSVPSSGQIEVTAYGYTKRLFNFNWVPKPKMVRVFRSDPYAANTVHIYGENFTMQDSLYLAGKYLGYTFNGGNHIVTLTETVSGTLLLKGPGGADSVPNFSFVPSPIITTVSGGEVPGDTLTITGNHLLTTSKLTVGEVIVPGFIALDDHTLKAKLPPFPLGGVIGINTSGGTLTYPGFYNGWDSITYTPLSAKAGDTLTLTIHKPIPGWPMPADTRVLFQQSAGKIISINGNQIKVQVPFGYTNPTVSVTAFGITKHAPRPLTITFGNGPSLLHPYYFEHAKTLVPHRAIMQGFWLSNDADGDGLVDFLQIIADSQATLLV
ncbi:MAG TPA: FG-GAP-like repeat-containing protein, partial [Phnomibacter sp.]|nr:FG-GAP-like repeat-containing protein [Phnomibacter sp.]